MTEGPDRIADPVLLDAEERLDARDLSAAIKGFDAAEWLGADPDRCSAGRWMAWMLLGEFESAWKESDAIRRRGAPDIHRFWNGEDIREKRVVVRCLHGFGDAVQFLRYAPALRSRASRVIFEVAPRFLEGARCFDGVDHVITWGDRVPDPSPSWDVQIEVMELPYLFRTQVRDLPLAQRYLRVPGEVVARVAKDMGRSQQPRVGLVWSAGEWNVSRCVPLHLLAPVMDERGVEFWNLQGESPVTAEPCLDEGAFHEAEGCRDNILTLAAVISQLDLVITVDTLAAHLAGALGVPAWVMLQSAADWRWMTGTSRSPWYPSLRLFRQRRPGDWKSVVDDICRELHAWSRRLDARSIAS
jgi:hypothetical protein